MAGVVVLVDERLWSFDGADSSCLSWVCDCVCGDILYLGADSAAGDSGLFICGWKRSKSSVVAGSVPCDTFFSCNNDGWVYKYARKRAQLLGPHIGGLPNDSGICVVRCVGDSVCGVVYGRRAGRGVRRPKDDIAEIEGIVELN